MSSTPQELYSVVAVATGGGRNGHVAVLDSDLAFGMAAPPELGGSGNGANPEQLFAAGYAACFKSAFMAVCRGQHLDGSAAVVRVTTSLQKQNGAFALGAAVHVSVPAALPDPGALVEQASDTCPFSRAVRGNMQVELSWAVEDAG